MYVRNWAFLTVVVLLVLWVESARCAPADCPPSSGTAAGTGPVTGTMTGPVTGTMTGSEADEQDVEARLRFLRESMSEATRQERRYAIGWGAAYIGMTAGPWALMPWSDVEKWKPNVFSSVLSTVGGVRLLVNSIQLFRDSRRMDALFAAGGTGTRSRCEVLREAERLLERMARNERSAHSTSGRVIGFFTNVASALIVAYGFKQPSNASTNLLIGVCISQLMIATRPLVAERRLRLYREGKLTPLPPEPLRATILPALARLDGGYGAGVVGVF